MKKLLTILTVCALLLPQFAYADITTLLVQHYKFDEGSGTTAINDGSSPGDGNWNSAPIYITGKVGPYAAQLNNPAVVYFQGDGYVNFTSTDFSIAYWINPATFLNNKSPSQDAFPVIWTGSYQCCGYYTTINGDGSTVLATNQSGAAQGTGSNAGVIPLNTWTHVVYVRSGSNVDIYINGVDQVTTHGTHIDPTAAIPGNVIVGEYQGGYNWAGNDFSLDDLRFYQRALTPSDVVELCDCSVATSIIPRLQMYFGKLILMAGKLIMQ